MPSEVGEEHFDIDLFVLEYRLNRENLAYDITVNISNPQESFFFYCTMT
jgi:hypothetical protein